MSAVAIRAERLSKRFRIPSPHAPGWRQYLRRPRTARRTARTMDVEALRDVSFEVREGEVFGIIGRNGAGKSTLLKILSRITTPTAGWAQMRGRVASLLEVGTGFHPDLTGRENVFLNGMLLGMRRREIERAFDEIVEFAGIDTYIDTPIKRYSSGMQLRLAFAVAAHLAADIIIVDEVLAVGDAEFQAKCTRTMRDAASRGRTTLFVSHNMVAIENLCTNALRLERGRLVAAGPASDVVHSYLTALSDSEAAHQSVYVAVPDPARAVQIRRVSVTGERPGVAAQGKALEFTVDLQVRDPVRGLQLLLWIRTTEGQPVCAVSNGDTRAEWNLESGRYRSRIVVPSPRLIPRTYSVTAQAMRGWGLDVYDDLADVVSFEIVPRDVLGTGVSLLPSRGVTWMDTEFSLEALPTSTQSNGVTQT